MGVLNFYHRIIYRKELKKIKVHKNSFVTIIIPIRNRSLNLLENSLISISKQTARDRIRIILVDYGSNQNFSNAYKISCELFNVKYLQHPNPSIIWNKSKCLNYGIKYADTDYLLCLDCDMIIDPDFISSGISILENNPLALISTVVYDLPMNALPDFNNLSKATIRNCTYNKVCSAINFTHRFNYIFISGYNENFESYGFEDDEIFKRFLRLGLKLHDLRESHVILHQWQFDQQGKFVDQRIKKKNERRQFFSRGIRQKPYWSYF